MLRRLLPLALIATAAAAQAQQTRDLSAAPDSAFAGAMPDSVWRPLPPFSTVQPLLSRVAGVQVTPYSGAPGSWYAVLVRGATSLARAAAPLYVVDGVPVFLAEWSPDAWSSLPYSPPGSGGAFNSLLSLGENPLLSLPPEDIAEVEVLKSPIELARYGSQGANGVVRISTRRGRAGAGPRVGYAGYVGLQQLRRRYALLDAAEFATVANEAKRNSYGSSAPYYSAADIQALGRGTDWQREVFRAAVVHSQHLSISGGTERTHYYAAAEVLRQDGLMRNSTLNRYGLRLNADHRIGQRLTLRASLAASQLDLREPLAVANIVGATLWANPIETPRSAQHGYNPVSGMWTTNPVYLQERQYRKARTRRLLAQLGADVQLHPNWHLTVGAGQEVPVIRQENYTEDNAFRLSTIGTNPTSHSSVFLRESYRGAGFVADAGLRYQPRYDGPHQLTATFDAQYQRQHYGLATRYFSIDPNAQVPDPVEDKPVSRLAAATVGASYTFARRYEVQASLRADQALPMHNSAPTFFYPGGQLTWFGSREAFMPTVPGLDAWKLWLGAGRARGGAGLGYSSGPFYQQITGSQSPVYIPIRNGRQLYEYEIQSEAGLHTSWLASRLEVSLTAYRRNLHDGLVPVASWNVPVDAPSPFIQVRSQGLELAAAARWQAGRLRGETALAASTNQNRVQKLVLWAGNTLQPGVRIVEAGQPLSTFWGSQLDGLNPAGSPNAGQPRFRDLNGNGQYDAADRTYLGSGLPRRLLSLTQHLQRGRMQLDFQFTGQFGYQLYNPLLGRLDRANDIYNTSTRVRDRWTPANQNTTIPVATSAYFSAGLSSPTDQNISDADHLRLSQLTISYRLSRRTPIDVWAGGQNLFVLTRYRGYDPNVSTAGAAGAWAGFDNGAYPVPRVWQLGVRASL